MSGLKKRYYLYKQPKPQTMKTIFITLLVTFTSIAYCQTSEEYYDLAKEKIKVKDFHYALVLIEKSVKLDSIDIWNRMTMSDILLQLDRPMEAVEQLAIASKLHPEESAPYNRLGTFFLQIDDLDNAIFFYDKAIEHAPADSISISYYINRATAKGVLRKFDEAIEDMEKAYQMDPTNDAILNNLASFYQEVGQIDKGISMLKQLEKLYPEALGSYVNLGLIYSEIDSLELSEYYFNKGLELDKTDPLLLNNKGFLHYKKKEYSTALKYINESINIFPNNSYAYRNRALVYLALDLKKEACRDLSIAEHYEFQIRYGNEVAELIEKHCD